MAEAVGPLLCLADEDHSEAVGLVRSQEWIPAIVACELAVTDELMMNNPTRLGFASSALSASVHLQTEHTSLSFDLQQGSSIRHKIPLPSGIDECSITPKLKCWDIELTAIAKEFDPEPRHFKFMSLKCHARGRERLSGESRETVELRDEFCAVFCQMVGIFSCLEEVGTVDEPCFAKFIESAIQGAWARKRKSAVFAGESY